jgi:hypothetical protein
VNFETSRECNSDIVNHEKALLKYCNSYISTKKSKMNFETSSKCNSDKVNHDITLLKYSTPNFTFQRKKIQNEL